MKFETEHGCVVSEMATAYGNSKQIGRYAVAAAMNEVLTRAERVDQMEIRVCAPLEEKKKQAEAAEAAKKKAEEQKIAAAKADNCKRAMNSKSSLDSGMRMARMNDKGEREVLDDAQRAAELKRVNAIIASDCK